MPRLSRGQGAFEYLLIIGGSVLVAAVAMMVVQGSAGEVNSSITKQTHSFVGFVENLSEIPTAGASTFTPTATVSNPFSCDPACDATCKFCSSGGVCVYYAGYNCCGDTDCPSGYSCSNHLCTSASVVPSPSPTPSTSPSATPATSPTPTPTVVPIGSDSTCFMVSSPYYYKLFNSVTMTSGLSCVTFGRYSSGATLDCQGNKISTSVTGSTSGIFLGSGVSNITIVNCPIEGFNVGVKIDGASNIALDRLDLLSNNYGYYITNPNNIYITRNWITHYTTGTAGIYATYASGGNNYNLTLYDNYIDHFTTAVYGTGISNFNLTRAEFADVSTGVSLTSIIGAIVDTVKTYRASSYGLFVSNANATQASSNVFGGLAGNSGIYLTGASASNVFTLNTLFGFTNGVYVTTSLGPNTFESTNVLSSTTGVYLYLNANRNVFNNATINSSTGNGFYLSSSAFNTIQNSKISFSGNTGIEMDWSNNNSVYNSSMTSNPYGLQLNYANNNSFYDVNISGNPRGGFIERSNGNTFMRANISRNSVYGLYFHYGVNNSLNYSTVTYNGNGTTITRESGFQIERSNISFNVRDGFVGLCQCGCDGWACSDARINSSTFVGNGLRQLFAIGYVQLNITNNVVTPNIYTRNTSLYVGTTVCAPYQCGYTTCCGYYCGGALTYARDGVPFFPVNSGNTMGAITNITPIFDGYNNCGASYFSG